jgi:uncharacterized membrane protein YkoI
MNRTKPVTFAMVSVLAMGTLGAVGAAYAKDKELRTNDVAIMANAKITMAQAIATAEQETGGKAVGTGIEDQDGTVFLEVQVLKDNQSQSVLIDPQSGKVVKVAIDNEQDENDDEEDDD